MQRVGGGGESSIGGGDGGGGNVWRTRDTGLGRTFWFNAAWTHWLNDFKLKRIARQVREGSEYRQRDTRAGAKPHQVANFETSRAASVAQWKHECVRKSRHTNVNSYIAKQKCLR